MNNDIIQNLELDKNKGKKGFFKKLGIIVIVIIALFIGLSLFKGKDKETTASFETEKVSKGNLTITVSATGSLEPRNQVDVGSELSGIVKTVDVDFNDTVVKGQILATIDPSKLEAQVEQSRASLASANAQVLQAQATLKEAGNELDRLKKVWELSNKKVPSQQEMDSAEATLQRAIASEASANAQVLQAKATLEANETDLSKMVIRSPVNGIVLSRDVEPGQTVAASFQAPVLFTLAEDLTKMELSVDVDEADVGLVQSDQNATFTVDAYPDNTFRAKILKVKYGSETTEGVVTYETLLSVDNKDLLLRPGMTATAEIIVKNIRDSILVPNAALRYEPPMMNGESSSSNNRGSLFSRIMPGPPGRFRDREQKPEEKDTGSSKTVWILQDNQPVPVAITTGLTDGNMTQVTSGDLRPDMDIITGAAGQ